MTALHAALLGCVGPAPDSRVPFPSPESGDSADSGGAGGVLGLVQLDCEGWIGESMLVVGPGGTRVLLDVGNDDQAMERGLDEDVGLIGRSAEIRRGDASNAADP